MFLGIKILNLNYNDVFKASNPNSEKSLKQRPWSTKFQVEIAKKNPDLTNISSALQQDKHLLRQIVRPCFKTAPLKM